MPMPTSAPFRVLARDEQPDPSLYERQELRGVPWQIIGGVLDGHDPEEGVNYLEMRDGTLLSVLDRTVTAPGARRLRSWLVAPLRDREGNRPSRDGTGLPGS